MIPETWFNTVGQQHLKNFCNAIERAYQEGKARGLKPHKVNADDIFKIFRKPESKE